ncbi:MAG: hypothetical protein K2Q34_05290 [Alphaproteobacteria bacterium]|nr:hypothetical protein [Alphaproteobacteria bacterium]
MKSKSLLLILTLLSLTIETALASKLLVTNENAKELTVYIQAEGSLSEDLHWLEVVIPANAKDFEVTLTPKDMGGKATFLVRGRTNPLTPRGTCSNLSIDKNYSLSFSNQNLGTECQSKLS